MVLGAATLPLRYVLNGVMHCVMLIGVTVGATLSCLLLRLLTLPRHVRPLDQDLSLPFLEVLERTHFSAGIAPP